MNGRQPSSNLDDKGGSNDSDEETRNANKKKYDDIISFIIPKLENEKSNLEEKLKNTKAIIEALLKEKENLKKEKLYYFERCESLETENELLRNRNSLLQKDVENSKETSKNITDQLNNITLLTQNNSHVNSTTMNGTMNDIKEQVQSILVSLRNEKHTVEDKKKYVNEMKESNYDFSTERKQSNLFTRTDGTAYLEEKLVSYQREIKRKEDEIERINQKNLDILSNYNNLKDEKRQLKIELENAKIFSEKVDAENLKFKKRVNVLRNEREQLRTDIKDIETTMQSEKKELEITITKLQDQITVLKTRHTSHNSDQNQKLQEQILRLRDQIMDLEKTCETKEKIYEELKIKLIAINEKNIQLGKQNKSLYHDLETKMQKFRSLLSKKQTRIKGLVGNCEKLAEENTKLNSDISELNAKLIKSGTILLIKTNDRNRFEDAQVKEFNDEKQRWVIELRRKKNSVYSYLSEQNATHKKAQNRKRERSREDDSSVNSKKRKKQLKSKSNSDIADIGINE